MPAIVVVNASAPQPQVNRPVIVVTRSRPYRSYSIFGSLITLLIIYSVYWYAMRMRNSVVAGVNAAEHAEHAAEHSPPPPAAEHKKK